MGTKNSRENVIVASPEPMNAPTEITKNSWIDITIKIHTLENDPRKLQLDFNSDTIKKVTLLLTSKAWWSAEEIFKRIKQNSKEFATRFRIAYELNHFITYTSQKDIENLVTEHLCAVILMFEKLYNVLDDRELYHNYLAMLGTSHWLSRINTSEFRTVITGIILFLTENYLDVMDKKTSNTMINYYLYVIKEMTKYRNRSNSRESILSMIQPRDTTKVMQGWSQLQQELLDQVKFERTREKKSGISGVTVSSSTMQTSLTMQTCSFLCCVKPQKDD